MKKLNLESLKKLGGIKKLKRTLYKSRGEKLKQLISLMLVFGLVFSLCYFVKYSYAEYAVSRVNIVLSYPEISLSRNPDSSRFTYHDFICDENIEEALEIMRAKGKYENYTVDDLRDNLYLYSYLDESAGADVSTKRSEGNDYSYVANEFKITFAQPHDYKNDSFFTRIFTPDYSREFLEALVEVNHRKLSGERGGINGFKALVDINCGSTYDYNEKLKVYRTRIRSIMSYLSFINDKNSTFISPTHNMTLKDLNEEYQFLIYDKLDGISNFIETSGISSDTETAVNKLNVNIENFTLKHNKNVSASYVNNYAMLHYDHTFTENLINVVRNDTYGLYQARPKTAFDTIVNQKHAADEKVAEFSAEIRQQKSELNKHEENTISPAEYEALCTKCETLIANFENAYASLGEKSCVIVEEYLNEINEGFLTAKVSEKGLLSKKVILKSGFVFVIGAVFAFIVYVARKSAVDAKKIKAKKRLIAQIRKNEEGGAE